MKRALRLIWLRHSRKGICFGVFFLLILKLLARLVVNVNISKEYETIPEQDRGQFIQTYPRYSFQGSSNLLKTKKILIWTKFFGISPDIFSRNERSCVSDCGYECNVVSNKQELDSSDAILFHLNDSWPENWVVGTQKLIDLPDHRYPSQVWILANMEPLGNLWGDFSMFNGLINWTMWYRRDATIIHPYGEANKLQAEEKGRSMITVNYYRQKSRTAAVRISNCADYARRYRVVKDLQKYIDIDMYGTCYNNKCGDSTDDPYDKECNKKLIEYKFYLALENSFCRDYVTEKYWLSISRHQIPVVNWKHVAPVAVLPHSFINVYDFSNISEAAKYIREVNENETLYNSYFKWKETHIPGSKCLSCRVCRALNERPVGPQVYKNLSGWVYNDYCESVNEENIRRKNIDSELFQRT